MTLTTALAGAWPNSCWRIHACMAIAAAAPALIDRVEPYCVIDSTDAHAPCACGVRPSPSCPNSRTHALGRAAVSIGTAPGRLSIPISGRPASAAHAASASASS